MSWAATITATALSAVDSDVDTARFGVRVTRITVPQGAQCVAVTDVLGHAEENREGVVVLRYPAANVPWFAALVGSGRDVLLADTLVYWRLVVGEGRAPGPVDGCSAEFTLGIAPDLVDTLVADIFAGYGSHYIANPLFSDELALAGYQDWARRAVYEDGGVVLIMDGRQVGLATLELKDGCLEILLAGVTSADQGRGLYAHLLTAVETYAAARGASEIVISTQGHNTKVQRSWARYGFQPVATLITAHLMPVAADSR